MKVRRKMPICDAKPWNKHGDHPAVRHEPDHPIHKQHGTDPRTHGVLRTIAGHDFPVAPGWIVVEVPGGYIVHPPEAMSAYEIIEP